MREDIVCEICGYEIDQSGQCKQDGCKNSHFPYGLNAIFSDRDRRILKLIEEHDLAAEKEKGHRYKFSEPIHYYSDKS